MIEKEQTITSLIDTVNAKGCIDVIVRKGPRSLKVMLENEKDYDKVDVNISGRVLTVKSKGNNGSVTISGGIFNQSIINGNVYNNYGQVGSVGAGSSVVITGKIEVVLTQPESIRYASTSGTGDITIESHSDGAISAETSGTGDVIFTNGTTHLADLTTSGTGDINAKKLKAQTANIFTTGTGDVMATVTDGLYAKASGTGDITVYGNPAKTQLKSTGIGEIDLV